MNTISADNLKVRFTIDDVRTAQAAGATFARRLSGARSADFALALAEQEMLVERAIVEAGHGADQAQLAAGYFGTATRDEWARIISTGATWGIA